MVFQDFWDIVLNPAFLFTFGLVLAGFAPLLLSIWTTWAENGDKMELEGE